MTESQRRRQGERKSTRVGKAVERSPTGIVRGRGAVFTLVEKSSGLLSVQQVERTSSRRFLPPQLR